MLRLQPGLDDLGGPPPVADALLEMKLLPPVWRVLQNARQRRRARVAALHPRLREHPRQQRVDGHAQQLQRGRPRGQRESLRNQFLRDARVQWALVDPRGQLPGAPAFRAEAVEQRVRILRRELAQGPPAEPPQVLQ